MIVLDNAGVSPKPVVVYIYIYVFRVFISLDTYPFATGYLKRLDYYCVLYFLCVL